MDDPIQLLRFGPPDRDSTKLDAFEDMLIDRIDEMSKEEIERELREAGIDMGPAIEKMRAMIDKHKAAAVQADTRKEKDEQVKS